MDFSYTPNSLAKDASHLTGEDGVGSRFEYPKSSGTLAVSEGAPPGPRLARPDPGRSESAQGLTSGIPSSFACTPPMTFLPQLWVMPGSSSHLHRTCLPR